LFLFNYDLENSQINRRNAFYVKPVIFGYVRDTFLS